MAEDHMSERRRYLGFVSISVVASLLLAPRMARAQAPAAPTPETVPPALEGAIDQTYAEGSAILVKTVDGIKHLFHFTTRTVVHGATETDAAFNGLTAGTRVVVHYAVAGGEKTAVEVDRIGDDGLRQLRGVVIRVDRDTRRLSVRLADGSEETLELSDRAAQDAGTDVAGATKVIVYYTDQGGHKVAHYFREISVP
jgi:hypothetical protein